MFVSLHFYYFWQLQFNFNLENYIYNYMSYSFFINFFVRMKHVMMARIFKLFSTSSLQKSLFKSRVLSQRQWFCDVDMPKNNRFCFFKANYKPKIFRPFKYMKWTLDSYGYLVLGFFNCYIWLSSDLVCSNEDCLNFKLNDEAN